VPNARDALHGTSFTAAETTFPTVVYRRYTRGWRKPVRLAYEARGAAGRFNGPLIRARVGDRLRIHFKNMDTLTGHAHSMHFHGVEYKPSSDGVWLPLFHEKGGLVKPGQKFTYRLTAGPGSAGFWPYHDHSTAMEESIAGGLYGGLSIAERGERRADREFVVTFAPFHGFQTINGRAFVGNTPVFQSRVGESVQWNVMAMGSEFHTFHVHGHRWLTDGGTPEDTRGLGPAESFRVRWREDAPGTWLYHCHVEEHMMQGMIGLYRVKP
jgi:FtsP/CotA-like multicopper oxidase with cupredoxin domain